MFGIKFAQDNYIFRQGGGGEEAKDGAISMKVPGSVQL
jgi:hypothetical protein